MINSITFKSIDPFNKKTQTIHFGKINTIIGPKGSGKSTLYDLLANAEKLILLTSVKEALYKHKLEIASININNEEISANSLREIKVPKKIDEFKKEFYINRNNVIYQDDPIKKNLSNSGDFDKQKMQFAKKIVSNSQDIHHFITKIENLYHHIYNVKLKDQEAINFLNSLKAAFDKKMEDKIIFDLHYSSNNIIFSIKTELNSFNKEMEKIKEQINYYGNILNKNINTSLISASYNEKSKDLIKKIVINLKNLENLIIFEIQKLEKLMKIARIFDRSYNEYIAKIKAKIQDDNKFNAFKSAATNHFQEMGKLLIIVNHSFKQIINAQINFEINEKQQAGNLLDLSLEDNFTIEEEQKFHLLKTVLYNAKKIQVDVVNWIQAARTNNKDKTFDREKIINAIAKILKEKIKVLANGEDYDQMSLGQRSIYGIRYKFDNSKNMPLFLDQPEDNLDNHTIATNILDLINNKNEQLFIVTHNANIGIISKPNKVIVAKFEEDEFKQDLNQYLEGTIIDQEEKESDSAYFLEGGIQKIIERLKIIKGEK